METNEEHIKSTMKRLIEHFAKLLPDRIKATNDLWKFAKTHDRRNYQLIRFCMAPESDYRTMFKALVGVPTSEMSLESFLRTDTILERAD